MTTVELTASQADAVAWLAEQDFSPSEIAGTLSLPVDLVRQALRSGQLESALAEARANGARPTGRPRLLSPDQIEEAAGMRAEGKSLRSIGQALGVSRDTVRVALRRRDAEAGQAHSGDRQAAGDLQWPGDSQPAAEQPPAQPALTDAELAAILAEVDQRYETGRPERERRERIRSAREAGIRQPGDPSPPRGALIDFHAVIW